MRWPLIVSLVVGTPWISVAQMSPVLATIMIWVMLIGAAGISFGLLLFGYQNRTARSPETQRGSLHSVWDRMKSWFKGNF